MSTPVDLPPPSDDASAGEVSRRRNRRRTVLIAALALLTVAAVGLAWAVWPTAQGTSAAPTASHQPHAASSPTPAASSPSAPSSAPVAPGTLPPEEATTSVADFLTATAALSADSADTPDAAAQLAEVASGAIVAEIENERQELLANGWTQMGTPIVTKLTIVSTDAAATPPTAVAEACIDSSAVITRDFDGKPVAGAGNDQTRRALNIFTLEQDGSSWRVVARTFPNDPAC